jgi:DNA repair ATPase RecN
VRRGVKILGLTGLVLAWGVCPVAAFDDNSAHNCAIAIQGSVEGESRVSNICGIPPEVLAAIAEEFKQARLKLQDSTKVLQNLADERKAAVDQLRQVLDLTNGQIRTAFETLGEKNVPTDQLASRLLEMARDYNDLNTQLEETKKQLAQKGQDSTLVQTAQDLLHEGKLEEARAKLDRLIQSDDANVDRAAQDHFARAGTFILQYRLDEALPDYAEAYQYRPDDQHFAEE